MFYVHRPSTPFFNYMKNILLLAVAFAFTGLAASAQTASCCAKPAAKGQTTTEVFARFASNKNFRAKHETPREFFYKGAGAEVTFKTPDGSTGKAFEIKAAKPTSKYLFVIHEWWGLNDNIKREAETFAKELGVNILALDLYDGKIATTPEEAGAAMQAVKPERAMSIIQGAQAYAGPKAEIATLGWCFGGGWSLQAAISGGKQIVGCVVYYGMAEKDVAKLKTLNTDVLFVFAEQDQWINKPMLDQFTKDMATAGKTLTVKSFNADHAFANPSNKKFNKELADKANAEALAYLKKKLGV
jgi:carboxymethylenebutenolidase